MYQNQRGSPEGIEIISGNMHNKGGDVMNQNSIKEELKSLHNKVLKLEFTQEIVSKERNKASPDEDILEVFGESLERLEEQIKEVVEMVKQLPDNRMKKIVLLKYYKGYSVRECGVLLAESPYRINRVLKSAEEQLEQMQKSCNEKGQGG